MADQIISGLVNITNYNTLTVEVDYENTGSPATLHAYYTRNSDYSNLNPIPFVSRQSLGGGQYEETFTKTGLAYNTTYYIQIDLKDEATDVLIDRHIAHITTLWWDRLTLALSIDDKNLIDVQLDADMVEGDPACSIELHYKEGNWPSMSDPSLSSHSSIINPPHYEFYYTTPRLKYDVQYFFQAWIYETADPSNILDTVQSWIITDQDGSRITSFSATPEATGATVTANVTLATQDSYMMKIIYSTNSSLSPSTTRNHTRVDIVSLWDRIFYFILTNLHQNTQYYFRIELWNTTTNQYIDYKNGTFKTLKKDGWPLWMYLHYFV